MTVAHITTVTVFGNIDEMGSRYRNLQLKFGT